VDAVGGLFDTLFGGNGEKSQLDAFLDDSLSAFERAPFEWTEVEFEKRRIYLKLDKANPTLEQAADEWLRANDPDLASKEAEWESESEELFVKGPKKKPEDLN